ncbi:unnamed protein product [Oikopleura dioica]|uniref:Uncharacterized protein n=1 Tax=Oikopleura dioica TaxID=34765 RepID=E4XQB0_OIKDI|nr:unnamed protein product [Oikopleura dioica]
MDDIFTLLVRFRRIFSCNECSSKAFSKTPFLEKIVKNRMVVCELERGWRFYTAELSKKSGLRQLHSRSSTKRRSSFIFSKMKAKGAMDSDELPSDPKQTETSRLVPTWTPDAYSSPKSSKYVVEVGSFHVKAIFLFFFILLPVGVSMFGSGYLHNCQIHLPNQVQTVYAAQTSATPLAGISPNSNSLGRLGKKTTLCR